MDELALLRELADAAAGVDLYEDFGQPVECAWCRPVDPAPIEAARLRLYDALTAYREWQTVSLAGRQA